MCRVICILMCILKLFRVMFFVYKIIKTNISILELNKINQRKHTKLQPKIIYLVMKIIYNTVL